MPFLGFPVFTPSPEEVRSHRSSGEQPQFSHERASSDGRYAGHAWHVRTSFWQTATSPPEPFRVSPLPRWGNLGVPSFPTPSRGELGRICSSREPPGWSRRGISPPSGVPLLMLLRSMSVWASQITQYVDGSGSGSRYVGQGGTELWSGLAP